MERALPQMRPIWISMQFRGHSTRLSPGVLTARARAPSGGLVTRSDRDGVHGSFESVAGDEALLECRLTFLDDTRFEGGRDDQLRQRECVALPERRGRDARGLARSGAVPVVARPHDQPAVPAGEDAHEKLAAKPPRGVSKTAQYPGKHVGMTCVYHHPQKGHMGQVYCLGTAPYKIATASAGLRRP